MDLAGVVLADRYELRRLIARGGMGEVWHGQDTSVLQREVAIKLLSAGSGATSVRRFGREAALLARLQHPGITVVHDAGSHGGHLYIVMELLQGQDLARVMTDHPDGLPVERVLDLFRQIADALAAAHRVGVVHRDLKPANLFVQQGDRIKICDFGIARSADASDALTTSGVVLGTLPYMSPEQCQGRAVEAPADIYALGTVLFELLTGDTPFSAAQSPYALMRRHVEASPPRLDAVRPDVPRELADLVARMLAKDPGERPDVTALAPAPAGPAPGSTAARPEKAEERGPEEREPEGSTEPPPPAADDGASGDGGGGGGTDGGGSDGGRQATRWLSTRLLLPARRTRTRVLLAGTAVLCAIALGTGIAVLYDGEASPDRTFRTDGALEVGFSPDGSILAAGGNTAPVLRWNPRTGERIGRPLRQVGNVYNVAFSPDGTMLAASTLQYDGSVRVWNPKTGKLISECADPEVVAVAFHPDSTVLATANQDTGVVSLWNPRSGDRIRTVNGDITSLAFSPDGTMLAAGSREGSLLLWNPKTGERIGEPLDGHGDAIRNVRFSPDGTTLAGASDDGPVRLWDVETRTEIGAALTAHGESASGLAFSPDGDTLATAGHDGTVRLWNPETGEQIGDPLHHDGSVSDVAFSPDGTTLATASDGDTVALWRLPQEHTT
ncbi:WD40 repeat domain-containing serine/threonine protein kinase [Streptomyces sp. NPDC001732]